MAFNFKTIPAGGSVSGVYAGFFRSVGIYHKTVYCFTDEAGVMFHLWGGAVLNHLLYGMPFGTGVVIKYLGKQMTETSKNPVHIYEVEVISPPDKKKKTGALYLRRAKGQQGVIPPRRRKGTKRT